MLKKALENLKNNNGTIHDEYQYISINKRYY